MSQKYVFADVIEQSSDFWQNWVFRILENKWEKDCIAVVKKGNAVTTLVQVCFGGKQKGTFGPFVVKSVKAPIYLWLLELLILPVIQHINNTIGGARSQQDNSSVYKAKILAEFFDLHKVTIDDHRPDSPDLNPIEHIQVHHKRQLHKRYSNIATTPAGPDKVCARLIEVMPEVWDSLPEALFEKLSKSMPDGVAAIIAAKVWYTRYQGLQLGM